MFEPPFQGDNLIILGNNIVHRKHNPISNHFSVRFAAFVDRLLTKKISDRPSSKEAIKFIPTFIVTANQNKFTKPVYDSEGSIGLAKEAHKKHTNSLLEKARNSQHDIITKRDTDHISKLANNMPRKEAWNENKPGSEIIK